MGEAQRLAGIGTGLSYLSLESLENHCSGTAADTAGRKKNRMKATKNKRWETGCVFLRHNDAVVLEIAVHLFANKATIKEFHTICAAPAIG